MMPIGYEAAPKILGEEDCVRHPGVKAWKGFMLCPQCFPEPIQRTEASLKAIPRNWADGPRRRRDGILANGRPR